MLNAPVFFYTRRAPIRYDGENYRIGIVSITDRPYKTLTDAIRGVSGGMYPLRHYGK